MGYILKIYFGKILKTQKYVWEKKLLLKYFNYPMLFNNTNYKKYKENRILILILLLNKSNIATIINILYYSIICLSLTNIKKYKLILIKKDFITKKYNLYVKGSII